VQTTDIMYIGFGNVMCEADMLLCNIPALCKILVVTGCTV